MENTTFIIVRSPLEEVNFGKKNGRWGKMVVVKGAKVLSGKFTNIYNFAEFTDITGMGALLNFGSLAVSMVSGSPTFRIGSKGVALNTLGEGVVELIGSFDTLERFRTDNNKNKYYVQLHPRPIEPYSIKMDISQNVKELNQTGQCFRVINHNTKNKNGGKAGILIHEAPHPGWLIGCIAPRELGNKTVGNNKISSRNAMEKIFRTMGILKREKS